MYDLPPDDSFRPVPTMPWGSEVDDPKVLQDIEVPAMKEQDFQDSYTNDHPAFVRPGTGKHLQAEQLVIIGSCFQRIQISIKYFQKALTQNLYIMILYYLNGS